MPDINKEIDDLLEDLASPSEEDEDIKKDEDEEEEEQKEQEDEEQKDEEEQEDEELDKKDSEDSEDSEEDDEDDENEKDEDEKDEDNLQKENERLRKLLEETAGNRIPEPSPQKKEEERKKDKKKEFKFVDDDKFNDALLTPEALNSLLTQVYERAKNDAIEESTKQSLQQTPEVVTRLVSSRMELQNAINEFYQVNPDLREYKQFVGMIATELRANNPDWDTPKLMEGVAKESKKRLGIKANAKAINEKGRKGKKPAFASPSGNRSDERKRKKKVSALQGEINDLIG